MNWPETRRAWRRLKAAIEDYRKARAEHRAAMARLFDFPPPESRATKAAFEAQEKARRVTLFSTESRCVVTFGSDAIKSGEGQ